MSRRIQMYVLIGLGVVLAAVVYNTFRNNVPTTSGVLAENSAFQPLDIQEPSLHLDRLERLRKMQNPGPHRNIFTAAPAPAPGAQGKQVAAKPAEPFVGPRQPPPPPPLQIPAEFFGYATRRGTGKRVAFFTSGDDVLVVAEGDSFLGRYRLVHIGNDTAEIEELGTGRRTTVNMIQPPGEAGG